MKQALKEAFIIFGILFITLLPTIVWGSSVKTLNFLNGAYSAVIALLGWRLLSKGGDE